MTDALKFGLDTRTIQLIHSVFSRYSSIESVVIYGSRAKGNFKTGSDIDLAIKAPSYGTTELLKIEGDIEDLMLAYKFDISLFHQIENPDLLAHIERVGQPFFPR